MSLTDGLVFEQEKTFTSPNKLYDMSREQNTVTDTSITYAQEASGLYVPVFNGTTSVIEVADSPSLNLGSAMAVSVWTNVVSQTTFDTIIGHNDYGANQRSWALTCESTNAIRFYVSSNGTTNDSQITTSTSVLDGNYHHLVCTFVSGASGIKMYSDAVNLAGSGYTGNYTALQHSTGKLSIGSSENSGTPIYFVDGKIALAKVWNRALSATEIRELFDRERVYFGV